MLEIGQTLDTIRTLYVPTLQGVVTSRIIVGLEKCMRFAGEWTSLKLKQFPEFSIASSQTTRRPSLSAGNVDLLPYDPGQTIDFSPILPRLIVESESNTDLPLGRPDLVTDLIQHWQNIASIKFAAGDYRHAEAILQTLLEDSKANQGVDYEWRDEAMVMLGTVYCKLGKYQAADNMIQQEDFTGKNKVMEMLAVNYCQHDMWEEAERLLRNPFEGRDEALRKLAQEFYGQGKWHETEMLLRSEFEGKDAMLELLGLAYCKERRWDKAENIATIEFEGRNRVMDKIAASYCQFGKVEEAAEIVLQLLRRPSISADTLDTTFALAKEYLGQGDFKKAERFCLTTIRGRELQSKKGDNSYYQSITLLIQIYETQGVIGKADAFRVLLPAGKILTTLC